MAARKLNLVILISGRGSNMEALINACAQPGFPARVAAVISNRPGAPGLTKAAAEKIAVETIDHKQFSSKADFETALHGAIKKYDPDIICLAGFMRILSADFVRNWPERIVNIHPSLLPDYKGLDTHGRVLADGCVETGCTVHYVIPEMDEGPVILQKKVRVLPGDDAEILAARVLEQEHIAYPEAIRSLAEKILTEKKAG
ncbi:MAG TPA: phosphoribosylglycinamide formyltransferase [Alphaproteobacteria bacterium]